MLADILHDPIARDWVLDRKLSLGTVDTELSAQLSVAGKRV
jgi:hypothetical protein